MTCPFALVKMKPKSFTTDLGMSVRLTLNAHFCRTAKAVRRKWCVITHNNARATPLPRQIKGNWDRRAGERQKE